MSLKNSRHVNGSMPIRISKRYPKKQKSVIISSEFRTPSNDEASFKISRIAEDKENCVNPSLNSLENGELSNFSSNHQNYLVNELDVILEQEAVESHGRFRVVQSPVESVIDG